MNFSLLADINGAFKSFFASLATSISYDIIFYTALAVQVFIIAIFAIKTMFSYEIRMTKALDKLNRWLFRHKTMNKNNVKEFTRLIKKAPKRLGYNWQQYILYRDKAPSEYMSVENIVEKPVRVSAFNLNVRNMNIISIVWMVVVFLAAIASNNSNDTPVSATMLLSILIIPLFLVLILVISNIIFSTKKGSNLDELYQNLHLFNRFIDNACTELPKYIDYSLLFTNHEIARGIPELREYYENRARKEKEEFEKAREEEEKFEQYDFSGVGIDGANILERALKETEGYLNKKAKILTNIAERESSLDSLKKNFDNIQKEFQKKMQVSKENIDRLRQQQEETTSRIEGNFLRRQMESTIAKQEGEEAEYENQKRNYLTQKAEYEDQIKTFNDELEKMKDHLTTAMESEYETFYEKLFKSSMFEAEGKLVEKINRIKEERDAYEDELTDTQTKIKRLIDENETLRNKLGITDTSEILKGSSKDKKKKNRREKEEISFDRSFNEFKAKVFDQPKDESFSLDEEPVQRIPLEEEPATTNVDISPAITDGEEIDWGTATSTPVPEQTEVPVESEAVTIPDVEDIDWGENVATVESPAESDGDREVASAEPASATDSNYDYDYDYDYGEESGDDEDDGEEEATLEMPSEPVDLEPQAPKRGRGRPKGSVKTVKEEGPKRPRGRPKGSVKKPQVEVPTQKRGRGRPRKVESIDTINQKIDKEEQKLVEAQQNFDKSVKELLKDLDTKSIESVQKQKINQAIEVLKKRSSQIDKSDSTAIKQIEEINGQISELIDWIQNVD